MLKAIALAVGATALAASAVTGVSATSAVVPNPAGSAGFSSSVGVPVVGGQVGTVDHSNTVTLIYGSTSQYQATSATSPSLSTTSTRSRVASHGTASQRRPT